jgi:hypothetical protein
MCGCEHPKIAYNIPFHFIAFFFGAVVVMYHSQGFTERRILCLLH